MFRNYHGPGGTMPIDENTKDEVVRLTVEEEKRPREIAEIIGISESSVKRILCTRAVYPAGSRGWNKLKQQKDPDRVPLTPEQFAALKVRKAEGSNSGTISHELGVQLGEANAAWVAPDYEYYLKHR